jgi:hypothetical protein
MLDFVNNGTTDLYNSARYFDGTSTYVMSANGVSDPNSDWTLSVSFNLSIMNASNPDIISQQDGTGTGRSWLRARSGTLDTYFGGSSSVLKTGLVVGTTYTVTLSRSSGTITGTIDGGAFDNEALNAVSPTVESCDGKLVVGSAKTSISAFSNGIIWGVNYNDEVAYTGLGTSVTAWEDTIGSNNGTETNGAAYTGQPFNGFVSTWYDQSGNANDATQATTTAQPKIVDAGALVTGGLDFDGVDDYLSTGLDVAGVHTSFTVSAYKGSNSTLVYGRGDAISRHNLNNTGGTKTTLFSGGTAAVEDSGDTTVEHISTVFFDGATAANNRIAFNGNTLSSTGASSSGTNLLNSLTIGAELSSITAYGNSLIAELVLYPSDEQSNIDAIRTNINDHYSIY